MQLLFNIDVVVHDFSCLCVQYIERTAALHTLLGQAYTAKEITSLYEQPSNRYKIFSAMQFFIC